MADRQTDCVDTDMLSTDQEDFAAAGAYQQREPDGRMRLNCAMRRDCAHLVDPQDNLSIIVEGNRLDAQAVVLQDKALTLCKLEPLLRECLRPADVTRFMPANCLNL